MAAEPEESNENSGAPLSQEEIEKLLAQNMGGDQAAESTPEPQPAAPAVVEQPAQPQAAPQQTPSAMPQQPVAQAQPQQATVPAADAANVAGNAAAICGDGISAVWYADALSADVLYAAAAATGGAGAKNY